MNSNIIRSCLQLLENNGIIACLIGELALNYYNIPRVVHDLEICVAKTDLSKAESALESCHHFEATVREEYNIYTEYQRGFPRFRYRSQPHFDIVLFSSEWAYLHPLKDAIIPTSEHQKNAEYSHEITDWIPTSDISMLPLPRLKPFLKGMCRKFCETGDVSSRIAAEQLVDGMDLDIAWCRQHMSAGEKADWDLALALVEGKASRADPFFPNKEVQKLVMTPGRN